MNLTTYHCYNWFGKAANLDLEIQNIEATKAIKICITFLASEWLITSTAKCHGSLYTNIIQHSKLCIRCNILSKTANLLLLIIIIMTPVLANQTPRRRMLWQYQQSQRGLGFYLPSENDGSNLVIIPGIIESAHKLLHRLRSESISPLRSIDCDLQAPKIKKWSNQAHSI